MIGRKNYLFKGQAHVVGAMIVFSIGVIVVTGSAFLFNSMNSKVTSEFQLKSSKEVLEYTAARISSLQKMNATYASVTFPIPAQIGGEPYILRSGSSNELVFITREFSSNISSPVDISGFVNSNSGGVMLIYENNAIKMRGVFD